jgi:hypothetical protein
LGTASAIWRRAAIQLQVKVASNNARCFARKRHLAFLRATPKKKRHLAFSDNNASGATSNEVACHSRSFHRPFVCFMTEFQKDSKQKITTFKRKK